MTEAELWEWMMDDKMRRRATATIKRPVVLRKWQGHGATPEFIDVPLAAGTRVKCVMASRFGDIGITDDLTANLGYHYRTQCVPFRFVDEDDSKWRQPADLLADIEAVTRPATADAGERKDGRE